MNASELKYSVEQSGNEKHFFDRQTMRFFGDSMRNYGVRSAKVLVMDYAQEHKPFIEGKPQAIEIEVWELYRRRAVKHGLRDSAYFNKQTLQRVFPSH